MKKEEYVKYEEEEGGVGDRREVERERATENGRDVYNDNGASNSATKVKFQRKNQIKKSRRKE